MKKMILLFLILIQIACLKAKKAGFDFSNSASFGFVGFLLIGLNNSNQSTFNISGTITGMDSGTSMKLLNNNVDEKTITTSKFEYTGILSGSNYSISLKQNPDGKICLVTNGSGKISANVTNVLINCTSFAAPSSVYASKTNWNDYIIRNGSTMLNANPVTDCDANSGTNYFSCIAAWLVRKVDITDINSCSGITATDSESALNWRCQTNSNSIIIYSTYLNDGKGLSDLLDWTVAPNWKNMTLTVFKDGNQFAKTSPAKWWTQAIDNTQPTNATDIGAIHAGKILAYTGTSYSLLGTVIHLAASNNKTTLIFNPNNLITLSCNGSPCISTSSNFNWIEGKIIFNSGIGIQIVGNYGVIKNSKIKYNGTYQGTYSLLIQGNNSLLESIHLADLISAVGAPSYATPIAITSSSNILKNITITNTLGDDADYDLRIASTASNNTVINFTSINSGQAGIYPGKDSRFFNASVFNATNQAVYCGTVGANDCAGNIFSNLSSINNSMTLQFVFGGNSQQSLSFQNLVNTANSSGTAISLPTGNAGGKFTGVFKNTGTCTGTCSGNASGAGLNTGCVSVGASDFTTITTPSITNSYRGYAVADSTNTTSGLSGSFRTYGMITDWLRFDNPFRGIGIYNLATFPNSAHQGRCTSNCTIWDFSLKSTDTVLRNANLDTTNGGHGCPTGNSTITHSFVSPVVTVQFLRNTVEILGDGIGDDDGFCESNEECLLTPNVGSYQGHGNLVSASKVTNPVTNTCADITTGGTITNVKLWKYETNGY